MTINNVPSFVGNIDPYTVTFEFSEDVLDFVLADIQVANGSASDLTAVDGNTYTAVITPDGTSDIIIELPAGSVTDSAGGDTNLVASVTTVYNASIPSVVIQNAPSGVNNTAAYTVTFVFSEDVTGFDASDVVLANASAGTFTAVSASNYTLVVTPDGTGDISIEVPEGSAVDVASNGNSVAVPAVTVFDNVQPGVDIQLEPVVVNSTAAYPVVFQFDETVTGFSIADVSVTNGTVGSFVAIDGDTYQAQITPSGTGTILIDNCSGSGR